MAQQQQRPPGWYDDGHGEIRWWSGRGWTVHRQPAVPQQPAPIPAAPETTPDLARLTDPPAAKPTRMGFRGRTVLLTAGAAAVLGLLVGISAGGGAGGAPAAADPTSAPAYLALQQRLTATVQQRDALQDQAATLDERASTLTDREQQLTDGQQDLAEATTALKARATALDRRDAKLTKQARALKTRTASSSKPKAKTVKAPVSVYYANCTAARAAGAAPVRVGDPGYAAHLDRDGDGVGCE